MNDETGLAQLYQRVVQIDIHKTCDNVVQPHVCSINFRLKPNYCAMQSGLAKLFLCSQTEPATKLWQHSFTSHGHDYGTDDLNERGMLRHYVLVTSLLWNRFIP